MAGQFVEDFMKPLQRDVAYQKIDKHPLGATEQDQFEAARFMANVCYDSIRDTLPNVSEAMEYLQGVTEALARENKPIRWTTPSGFPIAQDYRKTRAKEIKIFLYDRAVKTRSRSKVTLREELPQTDVSKSTNGIAPNFIHGCDAAHMHLLICKMLDEGTAEDFFMIHDSFSVSGDTWDLFDSVRDTFINMYAGDCVFERFENEIRQQLDNPAHEFPKSIPARGTLDLEAVRMSQFCFS
jgi:DNA-directed RNA polymerase